MSLSEPTRVGSGYRGMDARERDVPLHQVERWIGYRCPNVESVPANMRRERALILVRVKRHLLKPKLIRRLRWYDIRAGLIKRCPNGWPSTKLPSRPEPKGGPPTLNQVGLFLTCAEMSLRSEDDESIFPFKNNFRVHDLVDFKMRVNRCYTRYDLSDEDFQRLDRLRFDDDLVDRILYYLDNEGTQYM